MTDSRTDIVQIKSSAAAATILSSSTTPETQRHSSAYVRQVRQALVLAGLERVLADIYGERGENRLGLSVLLQRLNFDPTTIKALEKTEGHPLANKLVDRLSHRLALTAEGQKQFQILQMLYGLTGEKPRSVSEIAAGLSTSPKDIKHLSIMMRCRLEAEPIRRFVEDSLQFLVRDFEQSELFARSRPRQQNDQGPAIDMLSALKQLESTADRLVGNLASEPTVNISGKAGTGKTSLALKVTARLLQQGKRVLFVCHSRFFAQQIQNITSYYPGDLTVSTFHALCHQFARQAEIEIPSYRNNKVFNELFPELLIEAMHKQRENAFDAVVVDEGHALLPNFWRALKFCLKDMQGGSFFYFYDPQILALAKNKSAPFAACNMQLQQELRANFNLTKVEGGLEIFEALTKEEAGQAVSKIVADQLAADIRPDEIVILTTDAHPKISSHQFTLPRGVKLAATLGNREKYILYTSLSSFRALTKKVVILSVGKDIEDLAQWKLNYLSYSAFSRAEQRLFLVGNLRAVACVLPDGIELINPEALEPQLRR
ncbi:MAG: DEAD/DEAH box helicase family protein [Cyanobacteria bacterium SZAS LIN-3]|nr:DEAD/DEAH box helicase family protein [Cyanobacteria bacterium SZAS LIN-3]